METACTIDGVAIEDADSGLFSRSSAGIKQRLQPRQEPVVNDCPDVGQKEDNLVEEYACKVNEERLKEAINTVVGTEA